MSETEKTVGCPVDLTVEQRIEFHAAADFFVQIGFDYEAEQYVVAFTDRGRADCGSVEGRGDTLADALTNAERGIGL
jgi:hypothetical protein